MPAKVRDYRVLIYQSKNDGYYLEVDYRINSDEHDAHWKPGSVAIRVSDESQAFKDHLTAIKTRIKNVIKAKEGI